MKLSHQTCTHLCEETDAALDASIVLQRVRTTVSIEANTKFIGPGRARTSRLSIALNGGLCRGINNPGREREDKEEVCDTHDQLGMGGLNYFVVTRSFVVIICASHCMHGGGGALYNS